MKYLFARNTPEASARRPPLNRDAERLSARRKDLDRVDSQRLGKSVDGLALRGLVHELPGVIDQVVHGLFGQPGATD